MSGTQLSLDKLNRPAVAHFFLEMSFLFVRKEDGKSMEFLLSNGEKLWLSTEGSGGWRAFFVMFVYMAVGQKVP